MFRPYRERETSYLLYGDYKSNGGKVTLPDDVKLVFSRHERSLERGNGFKGDLESWFFRSLSCSTTKTLRMNEMGSSDDLATWTLEDTLAF